MQAARRGALLGGRVERERERRLAQLGIEVELHEVRRHAVAAAPVAARDRAERLEAARHRRREALLAADVRREDHVVRRHLRVGSDVAGALTFGGA